MRKFDNPAVAAVFKAYPDEVRMKLLRLRELVFDTGSRADRGNPQVGTAKLPDRAIESRQRHTHRPGKVACGQVRDVFPLPDQPRERFQGDVPGGFPL